MTKSGRGFSLLQIIIVLVFYQIAASCFVPKSYGAHLELTGGEMRITLSAQGYAETPPPYGPPYESKSFGYSPDPFYVYRESSSSYYNQVEESISIATVKLDLSTNTSWGLAITGEVFTTGYGLESRSGMAKVEITKPFTYLVVPDYTENYGDSVADFYLSIRKRAVSLCFSDPGGGYSLGSTVVRINGEPVYSVPKLEGLKDNWFDDVVNLAELPVKIGDVLSIDPYEDVVTAGREHDGWMGYDFADEIGFSLPVTYTHPPGVAPLPGTALLLGTGFSLLAIYRHRKMKVKD